LPTALEQDTAKSCVLLVSPLNSYRIAPYLRAANHIGITLILVSNTEHALIQFRHQGIQVDFNNPEKALQTVLDATAGQRITSVIGTDDSTVEITSRIAQSLKLPHNPVAASQCTRRKDLARQRLKDYNVSIPAFQLINLTKNLAAQIDQTQFPAVLKPLMLSGSRGVIRVNNMDEYLCACLRIEKIIQKEYQQEEIEGNHLLLEAYIAGAEFAIEGLLEQGKLDILSIFDKPDPLQGPYFEESYYITPSRLDEQQITIMRQLVQDSCKAYGLQQGAVHAEIRLTDEKSAQGQQAYLLELASRSIGGQCAKLLQFGTGASLEEILLRSAIGEKVAVKPRQDAAGVLMIPIPGAGILKRVEGILKASRVKYIDDIEISVSEGFELVPLPEGSSYLGFIFAHADEPELVESALREAHSLLKFIIKPVWSITPMEA